jgi:hypothetical protein
MWNFAMTIWNSTCNPCFSTFDQFFFVFHGLKTSFFCYSLKFNFICYPNRFFTYDYSLWDGGDIRFCGQKQTLIFFRGVQNKNVDFYFYQRYAEWKCWLFVLFFSEVCRMKMLTVLFFFRGMQNENVDCLFYFFQRYAE